MLTAIVAAVLAWTRAYVSARPRERSVCPSA